MERNDKGQFQKGHSVSRRFDYPEGMSSQNAYYHRHKSQIRAYVKVKLREQRLMALEHYGGSPPSCRCCGETIIEFLSFDHINGGGSKHRKSGIGNMSYWLVKNNFPIGFQILCHNCNQAKAYYGQCPHKLAKEIVWKQSQKTATKSR